MNCKKKRRVVADTYPLAIVVEKGLELDNVGVADNAHDLEFTVLDGGQSQQLRGRTWRSHG